MTIEIDGFGQGRLDMPDPTGFWSYAHKDDDYENGRIRNLAELLAGRVSFLTGKDFYISVDKSFLQWGDEWRTSIDEAVLSTTFLFPIVTPRYLLSAECRRELILFSATAKSRGLDELILPILYAETPDLETASEADEVVALLRAHQWQSFIAESLEDVDSSKHRKGVDRLARDIIGRIATADAKPTDLVPVGLRPPGDPSPPLGDPTTSGAQQGGATGPLRSANDDGGGDSESESSPHHETDTSDTEDPGIVDILADGEEALPLMSERLDKFVALIADLNEATLTAVADMAKSDKQGKGFAGRLQVSRGLAKRIDAIADQMDPLVRGYLSDVFRVDASTRTMFQLLKDTGQVEEGIPFLLSVRGMALASEESIAGTVTLADSLLDNAKFSKDLRAPSVRVEKLLRQMVDAQSVFSDWLVQIDDLAPELSQRSSDAS